MKIKKIEIKDYKAFYGKYTIEPEGKNLFVYAENGSGKSSLPPSSEIDIAEKNLLIHKIICREK